MKYRAKLVVEELELRNGKLLLKGSVYEDSRNIFKDGDALVTDRVKQIDLIGGYVMTDNSVFKIIEEVTK